jgi:hypothetical protein
VGDHVLLEDGACLAGATSGAVELSRERFIELAEASPYDDVWIVKDGLDEANLHSDIDFHFMGRGSRAGFRRAGLRIDWPNRRRPVKMPACASPSSAFSPFPPLPPTCRVRRPSRWH